MIGHDVPIPAPGDVAAGWSFNVGAYSMPIGDALTDAVFRSWSTARAHGRGDFEPHTGTQGGREQYSSRRLALLALQQKLQEVHARIMEDITREIGREARREVKAARRQRVQR